MCYKKENYFRVQTWYWLPEECWVKDFILLHKIMLQIFNADSVML